MKIICEKKEGIEYKKRNGAYAILKVEEKIAVVKAGDDYFLYGGGIEDTESREEALRREVKEESGYSIKNLEYFDTVKSFEWNPSHGNVEVEATIFVAEFDKLVCEKKEIDHELWIAPVEELIGKLYNQYQNYILEEYQKKKKGEQMKERELEKEIKQFVEKNALEKVGDNIYLTKYQQQVLESAHIPFRNCKDMSELLFLLSDTQEEEELDSLEEVAKQIEEFHYYKETNK